MALNKAQIVAWLKAMKVAAEAELGDTIQIDTVQAQMAAPEKTLIQLAMGLLGNGEFGDHQEYTDKVTEEGLDNVDATYLAEFLGCIAQINKMAYEHLDDLSNDETVRDDLFETYLEGIKSVNRIEAAAPAAPTPVVVPS